MKKIKLLLAALAAMVGLSSWAQSWTAPTLQGEDPVSGTAYKIYNVGADMYLNGGKAWFSWSTTAILSSTALSETFTGNASSFTLKRSDGKFVFTSGNDITGDAMHVDGGSATNYGLTKQSSGYYRIHDAGGDGSLCWGYNSTFHATGIVAHADPTADGWNCEWAFLTDQSYLLYNARVNLYNWYLEATEKGVSADAYKTVYDNNSATVDELNSASTSLKQDILEALVAAGNYPVDVTKYTLKNPDFEGTYEGWTRDIPYGGNCAIQGGSRMEYWAGNASDRANACFNIYQELTNLPNGVYTVSADMYNSLNSEGGSYTEFSPTCCVYGSASNEEVALCNVEGETLNTYTTGEILVFRGRIVVGTKNTTTPIAARWFVFDNVKLTYARQLTQEEIDANTLPESVSLDQTNVALTIYGSTTLEPTVLPANAGDKSITWTSSDESIATVSNGLVVAVGIGSATITATANGADGIYATANVTVSDVTPVAAPAYYSELAAGDFYIVNAATGKYLGGGNSWGTQASQIEHGIPFTVAIGDGVYTLDSHTYNNADDHFFNGTYVDGGSTNLYITSIGDGKYTISTANGSAYVTAKPGTTVVDNSAASAASVYAQWYFVSKADRDKTLAAATAENPVDATYYIKEANISRNLRVAYNTSGWTGDKAYGGNNENQCAERYKAITDVYQEINVPNGTYKVKVQGFYRQESGDAVSYLYANDQEEALTQIFSGGINNMAGASTAFSNGEYTTELEVTVTNRTLKVGVKCDAATNWTIFDNFELYMTGYTANTGVTADIDKEEIQIGQTATITASTDPASASFNAITSYSSSDESVATVDANGVVTGVAVGTATITVNANEMENNSTTVDITVTLVTPTAFELSETEVELDKETTTATLTINPTPEGANTAATWTSSDESVATVADGVVTAVSTGTATITATSVVDENVKATATVTVTFPETEVSYGSEINNGPARSIVTLGNNLIKNGTFEYPTNGYYGWKNGAGSDITSSKFSIVTDGDNKYLQAKESKGAADVASISTGWPIENGKTYVFGYKVKASTTVGDKSKYLVVSMTNSIGTETAKVSKDDETVNTNWNSIEYKFTNTEDYAYVQFRARWLANSLSFDDFYLQEVTSEETVGNVDYATAAIPTANIGTGAFQYSQDAIDAANALVQGTATVEDVQNAYNALKVLNEPADGEVFNIMITTGDDYAFKNNPLTFNADNASGAYFGQGIGIKAHFAQQVVCTKVEGNKYKFSTVNKDNDAVYIGTNKTINNSGNTGQIRLTTDVSKALAIEIVPTSTEGVYNLINTENSNNKLGCQDNPAEKTTGGLYTCNSHNDFTITVAAKPSVSMIIADDVNYGTRIFPFSAAKPEGITLYTCASVNGAELVLETADAIVANTPYIVYAEDGSTGSIEGFGAATADNYTVGLLTGVYVDSDAPVGTYVLQNKDKVAFYKVVEDNQPTVGANRAYLTAPANVDVKAFFFDEATAIKSVFDGVAAGNIYDMAGRKVSKMQKGGVYVVNGKKVVIK